MHFVQNDERSIILRMAITLKSDFPVTNEACMAATGKTFDEWVEAIGGNSEIANRRRDAILWIVGSERSAEAVWWATTIWVEYEKRIGRVQKDGRPEGYHICSTKSISAPIDKVQKALEGEFASITRVRDGKDIRATWRTEGTAGDTEVEVQLAQAGPKVGITLNHKRIPERDEADGARAYWSERLVALKAKLEG